MRDGIPGRPNPQQIDGDGDGSGEVCDLCPLFPDPAQTDSDIDEAGDACDCAPFDLFLRAPREIERVHVFRTPSGAHLAWTATTSSDTYAVARGLLSAIGPGNFGACLADEVDLLDGVDDDELPPAGDGFGYLVQGRSVSCGLGDLGFGSNEQIRVNAAPGACPVNP